MTGWREKKAVKTRRERRRRGENVNYNSSYRFGRGREGGGGHDWRGEGGWGEMMTMPTGKISLKVYKLKMQAS